MIPKRHYRKLFKNGNSFSLSIPKEFVDKNEFKQGDIFEILETEKGLEIRKTPAHSELDVDFLRIVDKGLKKYDDALRSLRDR